MANFKYLIAIFILIYSCSGNSQNTCDCDKNEFLAINPELKFEIKENNFSVKVNCVQIIRLYIDHGEGEVEEEYIDCFSKDFQFEIDENFMLNDSLNGDYAQRIAAFIKLGNEHVYKIQTNEKKEIIAINNVRYYNPEVLPTKTN